MPKIKKKSYILLKVELYMTVRICTHACVRRGCVCVCECARMCVLVDVTCVLVTVMYYPGQKNGHLDYA